MARDKGGRPASLPEGGGAGDGRHPVDRSWDRDQVVRLTIALGRRKWRVGVGHRANGRGHPSVMALDRGHGVCCTGGQEQGRRRSWDKLGPPLRARLHPFEYFYFLLLVSVMLTLTISELILFANLSVIDKRKETWKIKSFLHSPSFSFSLLAGSFSILPNEKPPSSFWYYP